MGKTMMANIGVTSVFIATVSAGRSHDSFWEAWVESPTFRIPLIPGSNSLATGGLDHVVLYPGVYTIMFHRFWLSSVPTYPRTMSYVDLTCILTHIHSQKCVAVVFKHAPSPQEVDDYVKTTIAYCPAAEAWWYVIVDLRLCLRCWTVKVPVKRAILTLTTTSLFLRT